MIFISRIIPLQDDKSNGKFFALGRIFSGKINRKEKVLILGQDYNYEKKI